MLSLIRRATVTAIAAWILSPALATVAPADSAVLAADSASASVSAAAPRAIFEITLDPAAASAPYTGRLYAALAPAGSRQSPRQAMHSWFNPPPVFAIDVVDLAPGDSVTLGAGSLGHPMALDALPAGDWQVQGVARLNPDAPNAGTGAGNLYSPAQDVTITESGTVRVALRLTEFVAPRRFRETDRVKLFEMTSPALSAFLGRSRTVSAGVVLPKGYAEARAAGATFPVALWLGGFSSTHHEAGSLPRRGFVDDPAGVPTIWVVPDPTCYRGHSVFADSANNGPWGRMLVEEMLPAIDAAYGGAGPEHRYVTGISSGGWATAWLQVRYPDAFAGGWAHVPDPVDFRDFQQIDLYAAGENMFVDASGADRPLARRGDEVMLRYRAFVEREEILGPGGQIHSFEAVFSPRGSDGSPRLIFDRTTGVIDTAVAETWRPYDIGHIIRTRWSELEPRLAGKLRVIAGSVDSFYLEGAVALLAEDVAALGADIEVTTIEGMGHSVHGPAVGDMVDTIKARWTADTSR